ncbi:hypothetical protein SLA2020_195120 [Shorea laevis]
MLLHFGAVPTLVVSSAEMAQETMKKNDLAFANRPALKAAEVIFYGYTDVNFSPYGEYSRQVKKIAAVELLSLKSVEMFQIVWEEEVAKMNNEIQISCLNGAAVNLSKMVIKVANNIISRSALGKFYGELLRRAMGLLVAFCFVL